ncbi:hypothetical protein LEP1GSC044_3979 [Leptospira kirschneri serovar Grippotyphosa str. RM52]|nr:hypothetical protein LEP1GSC044_3979 [Leptospira kirschneri serovar Grippotyphosa str. RM52]
MFQSTLLLKKRKNGWMLEEEKGEDLVSIHSPFKEEKEQRLDRSKNYIL